MIRSPTAGGKDVFLLDQIPNRCPPWFQALGAMLRDSNGEVSELRWLDHIHDSLPERRKGEREPEVRKRVAKLSEKGWKDSMIPLKLPNWRNYGLWTLLNTHCSDTNGLIFELPVISRIFRQCKNKGADMNKARVYRHFFKVVEGIQHHIKACCLSSWVTTC